MVNYILVLFPMLVLLLLTLVLLPLMLVSTLLTAGLWWVGSMIGDEAVRLRRWARR